MKAEIHHNQNLHIEGDGFKRTAIRAVIRRENEILMIHSGVNGDYKFPGGGVEGDESHQEALKREVLEECGYRLSTVDTYLGVITEYSKPKESHLDYFQMDSHYYSCTLCDTEAVELNLDDYEQELNFRPQWVDLNRAISVNREILHSQNSRPRWSQWIKRELQFLEYLRDVT